jgi:uncharacterized protein (TIGR03083 family)
MRDDFGEQIAHTLTQLADILEGLQPDEWGAQSLCSRWTVRDVAGHIVWRVGGSYGEMLRSTLPMLTLSRTSMDSLTDAVSRQEAEATSPEQLVQRLRRIAALRLAGIGRTGLNDLVESVVHTYDIVQPLGVTIDVDQDASRRVALRGLLFASPDRRVVVARNTLHATDAGWAIGRSKPGVGRTIEGSAQGIVLYLFGRRPLSITAA